MPLAGEFGDEADEGELAFAGDIEIQFDHADCDSGGIDHGVEFADACRQLSVVHCEA